MRVGLRLSARPVEVGPAKPYPLRSRHAYAIPRVARTIATSASRTPSGSCSQAAVNSPNRGSNGAGFVASESPAGAGSEPLGGAPEDRQTSSRLLGILLGVEIGLS
ncbi:MAG: hypothetical protein A49_15220 [Methyloceanibacter sp.]|nr:MAG: hypothetical protein A49_15220 [Methyloceanibacter sp.]